MDRKFQTVSASTDVWNDQNTGFEECHDCNMNQTLLKLKHHCKMCLHNAPATDARARSKHSLFKPCCAHISHVNKHKSWRWQAPFTYCFLYTRNSIQLTARRQKRGGKTGDCKQHDQRSMGQIRSRRGFPATWGIPCTSFPELRTVCSVSSAPIWSAHCPQHHG